MTTIYLGTKEGASSSNIFINLRVTINVSKSIYRECRNFEVVTYSVNYTGLYDTYARTSINSTHYRVIIYPGSETNRKSSIYEYKPKKNGDILKSVESYYHLLNSDVPFAVVFTTRDGKKTYCTYDKIKNLRNPSSLPGTTITDDKLRSNLIGDYGSKYKTLLFAKTNRENQYIDQNTKIIGIVDKYKKITFSLKPNAHERTGLALDSGRLFTEKPKGVLKNEFPDPYPDSVIDKKFYAVTVYYTYLSNQSENLAILLEFIGDCDLIHIKRIANEPPRWIEQRVNYNNDDQLIEQLGKIKKDCETAIIYMLDKNVNDGSYSQNIISVATVTENESGYNVYKHTASSRFREKNTFILYKNSNVQLIENDSIGGGGELETLNDQKFTEINTYALSDSPGEHLLIKLTKGTTNYYLHRYSKDGFKWRQVGPQELKAAGIDVISLPGRSLSQKLDKLIVEPHNNKVRDLLNYISFCISSIIVLLDQKSEYGQLQINRLIEDEIPPIDINKNSINVEDDTNGAGFICLKSQGYHVHKQHLRTAGQAARKKLDSGKLYLRFYLDKSGISLYDTSGLKRSYLEYQNNVDDLYVYYYGDKDPRPLLFCYGDQVYRPSSNDEYESKWVKVENIQQCLSDGNGFNLVAELFEVLGTLNPVNIYNKSTYPAHRSKEQICIKVEHSDFKSYKKYIHEPYSGYTLGNVEYKVSHESKWSITYNNQQGPNKVTVYYYNQDSDRKHPLLVELEFKGNKKEFHKLVEADSTYTWTTLQDPELEHEDKLLPELDELNKKFNSQNLTTLSQSDGKNDGPSGEGGDESTLPTALGSTGGALAIGGTGLVIYKYSDFFLTLLKKFL